MDNTTENTFDGSIEQAVGLITRPEEPEEEIVEAQAEEVEQEDNSESEDVSPEMEASESDDDDDADIDDGEEDEVEVEASEDDEEAEDEPANEAPVLYDVKVDGVEEKVTLDELKRGYSGQKYIQQKMQEVSSARKQTEEAYLGLQAEMQSLQELNRRIQSGELLVPPRKPSSELMQENPIAYWEQKAKYDEDLEQYQQQSAYIGHQLELAKQSQDRAKLAKVQQEAQKLVRILPDLADANKAKVIKTKMLESALNTYGFTQDEMDVLDDSRNFLVLHDAMKYREIMAGKSKAEAKAKGAKPVIKPGAKKSQASRRTKQLERQRAKLKTSGRIEDALGLIVNE